MRELAPVILTFIVFYFIYQTISLFARRKERMSLIEKFGTFDSSVNSSFMEQYIERMPNSSGRGLRYGCLLLGVGFGFVAGIFLTPIIIDSVSGMVRVDYKWDLRDAITLTWFSLALLFGGLGLLISHVIESRSCKK